MKDWNVRLVPDKSGQPYQTIKNKQNTKLERLSSVSFVFCFTKKMIDFDITSKKKKKILTSAFYSPIKGKMRSKVNDQFNIGG